jgi:dolichol kinase
MLSERWLPLFDWAGKTWLGTAVRDHVLAFPIIETFHLLALAILLGTVLIVNLRAFGIGRDKQIASELEPWMAASIVVLIASGIPMAMSEPEKCYESWSFPIKMILMVVAIVWHFTMQRRLQGSKLAATLSIVLWTGVGIAGKGIPYV